MAFFMVAALCCGCASNANNLEDNKSQTIVDVDQNKDGASTLDEDQTNVEENEDDDQLQGMTSGDWTSYTEAPSYSNRVVHIYNEKQLAYLSNKISDVGNNDDHWREITIYLETDLDMSAHYWNKPIGTSDGAGDNSVFGWSWNFRGTFDGQGHTIYGLTTSSWKFNCLFGSINNATIQNLNVVGHYNATYDWWNGCMPCGGIVSRAWNSTITNCTFDGKITTASDYTNSVGGIVGTMDGGGIYYCVNYAQMNIGKASYVGGLVGNLVSGVIDCSVNLCNFTSISEWTSALGGIVGYSDQGGGKVTDSANYATISTSYTGNNVGGIVGKFVNNYRIDRCINYGGISASNSKNVGGIIGSLGGEYTEWFQTKYRGTNALTNCISYGSVNGRENTGSVAGLLYCDVMRGCVGRSSTRVGSWKNAPSNSDNYGYADYWPELSSYQTESFIKDHSYDFSGTLNGFSCGSWSGAYSSWWKYNSAIYDFLYNRYGTGDSTTLNNIKYNSHYTCAVPNGITGRFGIYVYYKKSGVSSGYFDTSDKYVEISSRTSSGNYSYLWVDFLYSAPYSYGFNWSMDIFTISNSSNFTLDTSDYYYSRSHLNGYKCYSISPSQYSSTCAAVRFASYDGKYRAPNKYYDGGYIDLKFTAKAKKVSFSSNVSGCTIKVNGTAVTSANYYYRDNFSVSVTPRLGYYLSSVKDNKDRLVESFQEKTSNFGTKSVYMYDWYRYNITNVTFTFSPITYTVTVKYNNKPVSTSSVTWSTNGVKIDIENDDFENYELPFGYAYSYAQGFALGSYALSDEFSYDMTGVQRGSVSSSILTVEGSAKKLKTWVEDFLLTLTNDHVTSSRIPDDLIHIDPIDPGTGGTETQYESMLKATAMTLYLKAEPLKYNVRLTRYINNGYRNSYVDEGGSIEVGSFRNPTSSTTTGVTLKSLEMIEVRVDQPVNIVSSPNKGYIIENIKTVPLSNKSGAILTNATREDSYTDTLDLRTYLNKIYYSNEYSGKDDPAANIIDYRVYFKQKSFTLEITNSVTENTQTSTWDYYNIIDIPADQIIEKDGKHYMFNGFYLNGDKLLSQHNTYAFTLDPNWNESANSITKISITAKYSEYSYNNGGLTPNNVIYNISSKDDLIKLSTQVASGKSFAGFIFNQTQDINMNGVKFKPIGDANHAFKGVYNGNGYRITNLNFSDENLSYIGLFGNVDGATIKNLTINGGEFTGYSYVGIFAGKATNTKFENVHNSGCSLNISKITFYNVYGEEATINNGEVDYIKKYGTVKNLLYTTARTENDTISSVQKIKTYYAVEYVYDYNINKYGNNVNGEVMPINTCSNDVYDVARNSTEHGIGGIVGFAQNCQFLAVSANAKFVNGYSSINNVVGAMIGYGTGNTIDQCYAKPTTGSNVTEILANGNNTTSHVYISGHYSDDENTRRSLTDIWMLLNGEWVLKIFYW